MADAGVPENFIPKVLNHVEPGVMRRHYNLHDYRGEKRAALETLAVVAYRQPVTRARVSAVRGVNVDAVIRTLLARGLVTEAGVEHWPEMSKEAVARHLVERIAKELR